MKPAHVMKIFTYQTVMAAMVEHRWLAGSELAVEAPM
jgi:hypothetical protein